MLSYYARRAQEYELIYEKPERQDALRDLLTWLRAELAGHHILEIACGTGYWTERLADAASSILATDAGSEVLDVARAKSYPAGKVRFDIADAYSSDPAPRTVTAAFAGFWWSHIPRQDHGRFHNALRQRLGSGRKVVMIDNRYVEGSSTPIIRRDRFGNTYQERVLRDGTRHEVLKNFPESGDQEGVPGVRTGTYAWREFDYYWALSYYTGEG